MEGQQSSGVENENLNKFLFSYLLLIDDSQSTLGQEKREDLCAWTKRWTRCLSWP